MINKAILLLNSAKRKGIHIGLSNGELQLKVSKGVVVDPQLLQEIKENKKSIIEFLNADKWKSAKLDEAEKILRPFDRNVIEKIPLSFSQERLWFIDQLEGSTQYHLPTVLRINGKLNWQALAAALKAVVARHESLRSVIVADHGAAYQQVLDAAGWDLEIVDGTKYNEDEDGLNLFILTLIKKPFDLACNYMLRSTLVTLAEDKTVLVVTMHHIASDGWSLPIVVKEVVEYYKAFTEIRSPGLASLPVQYADYAVWQRDYLKGPVLDKKLDYWRAKLKDCTPLDLPTDFKRPLVLTGHGTSAVFSIDKALAIGINQLCQQEGTTLFMTLLAAFKILMHRYGGGQRDICVGTPIAGRQQEEVEGLIGFFVNTLALRSEVNDELPFKDFLAAVRITTMDAYDHQEVPFEKVVDAVVMERSLERSPLFQVMFILQNIPEAKPINLGQVELTAEKIKQESSKFEISFSVTERADGLFGTVEYNTDLFTAETIQRMILHYKELLSSIVCNPDQLIGDLQMLTPVEKDQLLLTFNDTKVEYPKDKSIVELFIEQVEQTPENIAIEFEEQRLSYEELNERSNQLAHYLIAKGVKAETLVPVCIERSMDMIVAILGILKSGGAYVPIDPEYPAERIQFMLEDTSAKIIVSSVQSSSKLPVKIAYDIVEMNGLQLAEINSQATNNLHLEVKANQLAYVIYTSGSTGKPKGVLVTNNNVVSLVKGIDYVSIKREDVLLSTGSSSFDATTFEYWSMLLNGGQLLLCTEERLLDNQLLKEVLRSKAVNKMWFTSSWFNQLVETDISLFKTLETILVGGEKLSEYHIGKLRQIYPAIEIINGYGPTENTTFSLTYPIKESALPQTIPIGRPLTNRSTYVLDGSQRLVPIGVPGEIYVSGSGLARGYLNRSALTSERFIKNPFVAEADAKMYRTGDIGRWLPDGNIEYLGRKDEQVKIRGYRIELGEIESVAQQSGLASQVVVLASATGSGSKRLTGYVVATAGFSKEAMIGWLESKLPEYMVPQLWIAVEKMPLTTNGKIDKKALPAADANELATAQYMAPRNDFEQQLAGVWQKLLGIEQVGIHDNFFELGGDSILTIQVVSRIRRQGYELHPKDIFIHQTIARLSAAVLSGTGISVQGEQGILTGSSGLLPIQQWYFAKDPAAVSYNNQAVLLGVSKSLTAADLTAAVIRLTEQHDALRFIYSHTDGAWQQAYSDTAAEVIVIKEKVQSTTAAGLAADIKAIADQYQSSLDITTGRLMKVVLIETPGEETANRLLVIIHHLAVDGVSWRILLEDLELLLTAISEGRTANLGPKSSSYRQWYQALEQYCQRRSVAAQKDYWQTAIAGYQPLPQDKAYEGRVMFKDMAHQRLRLNAAQTKQLLQEVPRVYHTEINDILLCALALTLNEWAGSSQVVIGLEGHGREAISDQADTSRTIGWFTSLYPLLLDTGSTNDRGEAIKTVKEQLRQIPDRGLGYGVLKYISKEAILQQNTSWDIVFNYLGQLDNVVNESSWFSAAGESSGAAASPLTPVNEKLSLSGFVQSGELTLSWGYSSLHYEAGTISKLSAAYLSNLEALITHCIQQEQTGGQVYTPSDYGLGAAIRYAELDAFLDEDYNGKKRKEQLTGMYGLSGLQQGMLFHGLYDDKGGAYTEQFSCDLVNPNLECLIKSWQQVMSNHSILRSGFYYDVFTVPVQCVYKEVTLPVEEVDYRNLNKEEQSAAIEAYESADRLKGFDFKKAPLMRIGLLRLSEDRYRMLWTSHHILFDGWSLPILMETFLSTYDSLVNETLVKEQAEDKFEDYIRYIARGNKEAEETYWRNYLSGLEDSTLLPFVGTTGERNKGAGSYGSLFLNLDAAFTAQLKQYAQKHRLTVNTVMQGVWSLLLHRYTGNNDIVYGTIVSGRPDDLADVERRVGMYINTLPLHSTMQEDELVTSWLEQLQQQQVSSRHYQYTPLHQVQSWSGVAGDLFDSILVFENYPVSELIGSRQWALGIENVQMHEQTNYPLSISVISTDKIKIGFSYNTSLLESGYVEEISGHFKQVLQQLVTTASTLTLKEVNLLTDKEKDQLLLTFNDTKKVYPTDKSIIDLFEAQVSAGPQNTALIYAAESLTYQELNERSNQLAHYLKGKGVKAETLVPICIERGIHMIVGILGIIKAGGAYVPIDPSYPAERIGYMLEDVAATIVLSSKASRIKLPSENNLSIIAIDEDWSIICKESTVNPETPISPQQLAYVIYTSGSTGKPKGVMIEHGSMLHYLINNQAKYISDDTTIAGSFIHLSYTFDASLTGIFMPLLGGKSIVIASGEPMHVFEDPNLLKHAPYDFIKITPSHLDLLEHTIKSGDDWITHKLVIGGEALHIGHFNTFLTRGVDIAVINEYGPTETTVGCSTYRFNVLSAGELATVGIPIGRPLDNTTIYVVDDNNNLVPLGVPGELCIGGSGLARGYLNREDLTAERFIKNPFSAESGAKMYRTGDIGRWLPDGNIEYLGRKDEQVKIRGYRIELGEIESVAQQSGLASQVVVLASATGSGTKRLTGYVVATAGFSKEAMIGWLESKLPEYMVPQLWIAVEKMPLTTNGKIDKKALPAADANELATAQYMAPRNDFEQQLAGVWQKLLGIEQVGIHDNFFELGGDSILTIQVVSRIRRQGYELHPKDIFIHQTIARLSAAVLSGTGISVQGEQGILTGSSGLLPIQQWYFAKDPAAVSYNNQAVLLGVSKSLTAADLTAAVIRLTEQHDALRFIYSHTDGAWQQAYSDTAAEVIVIKEKVQSTTAAGLAADIKAIADQYQSSLDITTGRLMKVVLIETPGEETANRLLVIIHHLAVDGVSWRILLEDLELLLTAISEGRTANLGPKSSSYRQWYQALEQYCQRRSVAAQKDYWQTAIAGYQPLPQDKAYEGRVMFKDMAHQRLRLNAAQTKQLLQEVPRVYHTEINDILLCALALTLNEWAGSSQVVIGLEGHGREAISDQADTSRTIGWFTSLYPLLLDTGSTNDRGEAIKTVKEQLRQIPDRGLGYGVLKYISKEAILQQNTSWDIVFNYLGQLDNVVNESSWFSAAGESSGAAASPLTPVNEKLSLSGFVQSGELTLSWGYSSLHYEAGTISKLSAAYLSNLEALITHCIQQEQTGGQVYTPSDYGLGAAIRYAELDAFLDEDYNGKKRKEQLTGMYGLSGLQQGMLFHGLYDDKGGAYTEQFSCDLVNPNLECLIKSWQQVMSNHSILRSGFYYDVFTVPVQCVYKEVTLPVEEVDYRNLNKEEQSAAIEAYESADRLKGFDFKKAPLMRIGLLRLSEDRYRMLWTSHHILFDGWSLPILMETFLSTYDSLVNETLVKEQAEDKFEDYIRYIARGNKEAEETYWRNYLSGLEDSTLLPFVGTTGERNKGAGSYGSLFLNLDAAFTAQLKQYAQKHRLTVNTVMQGVWSLLLHRYTGNNDIVYGTIVSGRPDDLADVERRVGMYINTLPLHSTMQEDELVTSWLEQLQQQQVSSRHYQYTPLHQVQSWSGVAGDLFDSILVFENYPVSELIGSRQWALGIENVQMHEQTNYPLSISVISTDKIKIGFSYNTSLLESGYVEEISGHFKQVLQQLVTTASTLTLKEVNLLTDKEKDQLLLTFNDTKKVYPTDKSIIDLFEAQVSAGPQNTALIYAAESLTYQELNERSNQLAHYLKGKGVKAETLVPVCIERSMEMIVAILGILKSGAAYVPIDPAYPAERIGYMLEDVRATIVLSSKASRIKLPSENNLNIIAIDEDWSIISKESTDDPATLISPQQLAYVIYTSGSTGKPKGVMIEHAGVVNLALSQADDLRLGVGMKTLQFASVGFDASCYEIFNTLLSAGVIVLPLKEDILSAEAFERMVNKYQAELVVLPPSYLSIVKDNLGTIKTIVSAGEPLKESIACYIQSKGIRLINAYGPTENTVCVSLSDDPVMKNHTVVIGKPIANIQVHILDKNQQLLPVGTAGEIHTAGAQLARGYLNRADLTAERFILNPFGNTPGARMYKTGDLGRWLPDGNIEYLGRIDHQVKIRGYRVELGEIENVLIQSGLVSQAVVIVKEDLQGHKRLVGYVVDEESLFDKQATTTYLHNKLPEYMIPTIWVTLKRLPVTASGKIDRKALPEPDDAALLSNNYIAPRNETEEKLAVICKELLGVKEVGMQDNFFELGGHSLLAMRLITAIKREFNVELAVRTFFELNTIERIANYIKINQEVFAGQADDYDEIKL
jgi:amino acid adenylation domain-containing protein/non-ribosomal peptide synthase protein (TIGR01720 family)